MFETRLTGIARPLLLLLGLLTCACGRAATAPLDPLATLERLSEGRAELPDPAQLEPRLQAASHQWAALAKEEPRLLKQYRANPGLKGALKLGILYTQAEEFEAGLDFLCPVLATLPDDAGAWLWLGVERLGNDDLDGAEACLGRAIEIAPKIGRAHEFMGRLLLLRGDTDAARAEFELATKRDAGLSDAQLQLAQLEEDAGDLEPAAARLSKLLRRDPLHPVVLHRLARIRRAEGAVLEAEALEGRHARAIEIDDLGLRNAGMSLDRIGVALGLHYMESHRLDEALGEFEAVLDRSSNEEVVGTALAGVADALNQLGRKDEARAALADLRAFDAEHPYVAQLEALIDAPAQSGPPNGAQH